MAAVFDVPCDVSQVHEQGVIGVFARLVHVSKLRRQNRLNGDGERRVASRQRVIVVEVPLFLFRRKLVSQKDHG